MLTFFMETTQNDTDFIKRFNYDLFMRQRFKKRERAKTATESKKARNPNTADL